MVGNGKHRSTLNGNQSRQSSGVGLDDLAHDTGHRGFDRDIIGEHFEKLHELLRHRADRQKIYCSTFTTDLGQASQGLVLFPGGLHLPDGVDIGSVWAENNGNTATISVIEGSTGSGRAIAGPIAHAKYKLISIADGISSISITTNVTNDTGLIVVTLFSHRYAPKSGTL